MNELIKIMENENKEKIVSGRELHEFLEVETPYVKWFGRMIDYDFAENIDFVLVRQKCPTNNPKNPEVEIMNHFLKLDMAKEISMIQRTEKGKQARQYFIQIEKDFKSQLTVDPKAALLLSVYNGGVEAVTASKQLVELETKPLLDKIEEQQPKVDFADKILKSKDNILVREFAKLMHEHKVSNLGERRMYLWLRESKYLMTNNEPYQKYMKYFAVKESTIDTAFGTRLTKTTLITPHGQLFLYNKLKAEFKRVSNEEQLELD